MLVGFGGYVATPAYLAARRRQVPSSCTRRTPGRAWRTGWAPGWPQVFSGHPDTQLANAQYIGIPLRQEISDLDRLNLGDKARAHFGLRPDLPILLVSGGLRGARSLNRAVFEAAG